MTSSTKTIFLVCDSLSSQKLVSDSRLFINLLHRLPRLLHLHLRLLLRLLLSLLLPLLLPLPGSSSPNLPSATIQST